MPSLTSNDIEIAYEDLGNPSDPAILLVMGIGVSLTDWPDELCLSLVRGGYRVIRFDNRDAGLSTKFHDFGKQNLRAAILRYLMGLPVAPPYTLQEMAADTIGLLDALGVDSAHIVGASMGGMIAQIATAEYPERIRSLVSIMSTSGTRKVSIGKLPAIYAFSSQPKDLEDPECVIEHLVKIRRIIGSPGYPMSEEELRRRSRRSVGRSRYRDGTSRQMLAILAGGSRAEQLKTVRVPTLVIHGRHDPLIPAKAAQEMLEHIQDAELLIIDGMGHDLPTDLLPTLSDAILAHCDKAENDRQDSDQAPRE